MCVPFQSGHPLVVLKLDSLTKTTTTEWRKKKWSVKVLQKEDWTYCSVLSHQPVSVKKSRALQWVFKLKGKYLTQKLKSLYGEALIRSSKRHYKVPISRNSKFIATLFLQLPLVWFGFVDTFTDGINFQKNTLATIPFSFTISKLVVPHFFSMNVRVSPL